MDALECMVKQAIMDTIKQKVGCLAEKLESDGSITKHETRYLFTTVTELVGIIQEEVLDPAFKQIEDEK